MALSTLVCVGKTEKWLDALVAHAQTFGVGAGWQDGVDLGPLITPESKQRVHDILAQAVEQGAEILLDGRNVQVADYPNGNFVGPTIVRVSDTQNAAYVNEIFGPVLTVLTADTLQDAIDLINANPYGNGVALFTSSGAAARKFTAEIEAGQGTFLSSSSSWRLVLETTETTSKSLTRFCLHSWYQHSHSRTLAFV